MFNAFNALMHLLIIQIQGIKCHIFPFKIGERKLGHKIDQYFVRTYIRDGFGLNNIGFQDQSLSLLLSQE